MALFFKNGATNEFWSNWHYCKRPPKVKNLRVATPEQCLNGSFINYLTFFKKGDPKIRNNPQKPFTERISTDFTMPMEFRGFSATFAAD
jgi:hypothetical protein